MITTPHESKASEIPFSSLETDLGVSFRELVRAKHNAALRYWQAAQKYDHDDQTMFAAFLNAATNLGVTRAEIAETLNVATSTLSRWLSGKSVPAMYARGIIVRRVADYVREKNRSEQECEVAAAV